MIEQTGEAAPHFTTLQSLMWPEQGVCTERDLYLRLEGEAAMSQARREIRFAKQDGVGFDTWFNLFNIGKWRQNCGLETLHLTLEGKGQFQLSVFLAFPHQSWERLDEIVTLTGEDPVRLDLSAMFAGHFGDEDAGIVFFSLKALKAGILSDARWQTTDPVRRTPELAIAITTFRREAAVARTVARFSDFIETSTLKDHIRLIVTDNGQTAEIAETAHVSVVPNENLGGAGGFSRGLIEARDRGASHCLFMDDDASIHMASLERTWMFLAYAINPDTAVAGAMINATHRWAIWENGALFDSRCRPLHMGTDLRDRHEGFEMEFESTAPAPDNFYGGWWYFAFPVEHVKHMPFPFFVRGDDVSFSLVHDFNIVTLNGVVSFQESFTDKESPQTWYLDLRSHMAHHLSLPTLDNGALGTLKIAVWFFLRNLPRMHYETLAAINLGLEDVMRGPEFFDKNADMAQRRADIKALCKVEVWRPAPRNVPSSKWRLNPRNRLVRALMKVTLNGHLVPFFSRFGNKVTLDAQDRGHLKWAWGAAEITYLSANKRKCYTVRHSKARLLRETGRFLRNAVRFLKGYGALHKAWGDGYESLTNESYWRRKLTMSQPDDVGDQAGKGDPAGK
ncbi:MAG TPA: glycosyltransferase, partial [Roseibacterium sp.]|nr:glycosyltransferase [Roseibacterium sp.]